MKIFTFWEPRERLPGYIHACMRTWGRYLPEADVVVLDFRNLGDYLPADLIRSVTLLGRKKMTLPKQTDIYRAFLLERHGGIWLDADTVLTPRVRESGVMDQKAEVTMFCQTIGGTRYLPGAFISAKPHAKMMRLWSEEILRRVALYRKYSGLSNRIFRRDRWRKCRAWHYFLNDIVNPLPDRLSAAEFHAIDMADAHALLHNVRGWPDGMIEYDNYRDYYFTPGTPEPGLAAAGVIMLQNSWTDERFREMSEDEFLRQDIRLAALLKGLLA